MDSVKTKKKVSLPLRRSTRSQERPLGRSLSLELTPRPPIKRTRKKVDQSFTAVVNGTKDEENEDEDSPSKKIRMDAEGESVDKNKDQEMEVSDSAQKLEKNLDQEMESEDDSSEVAKQPKSFKDTHEVLWLNPRVVLGERCKVNHSIKEDEDRLKSTAVKPAAKPNDSLVKSDVRPKSTETKHEVQINSMADYQRTMKAKAKSTDKPAINHVNQSMFPPSQTYTTQRHFQNVPKQKEMVTTAKLGKMKKTATSKKSSENPLKRVMWYFLRFFFLLLFFSSASFVVYNITLSQMTAGRGDRPSTAVKPEKFTEQFSLLETLFPNQLPELWKRSKIHLTKHLKTENPTEPVSMILTAGLKAEKTLLCLANSLASAFSSALNASVLHIDGVSKASKDSDAVKLELDELLQASFEGDKPVTVIHRFEELPPGSTLIFYRYCDHENAAYKKVFLLFTLLLPQDDISSQLSLKEVEELVQEHATRKLVGGESEAAFNKMDVDKFGGLWSRISHLILPVMSEVELEEGECP